MSVARGKRSPPLDWLKPAIVAGSLVPFVVLGTRAATHQLGPNPIATGLNQLGLLSLLFLLASLACSPIQMLWGYNWPIRIRKLLGLLAFFTALTHFLVYLVLDQGLALGAVVADVVKRPFIAVGFAALVLLTPLALTSTRKQLQRLGFARWKRLHRLAYVIGGLGVLHFFLRVKASVREPTLYAVVLVALLGVRVFDAARTRRKAGSRKRAAP